MKISERLQRIKASLRVSLADCRSALADKGVDMPLTAKVDDIATYIRLVFQSDFAWMFNFHKIDQFGNPHTINLGQPISDGLPFYNPGFELNTPLIIFDYNTHNQHEANSQGLTDGAFGVYKGGSGLAPEFDMRGTTTFTFNEEILPVTLEAANED